MRVVILHSRVDASIARLQAEALKALETHPCFDNDEFFELLNAFGDDPVTVIVHTKLFKSLTIDAFQREHPNALIILVSNDYRETKERPTHWEVPKESCADQKVFASQIQSIITKRWPDLEAA